MIGKASLVGFMIKRVTAFFLGASTCSITLSQSINADFDFSSLGSQPASTFGAAGLVGTWSRIDIEFGGLTNAPLLNLSGAATSATVSSSAPGANWTSLGPWTGNNALLMEDWLSTTAQFPVSGIQLHGLQAGNYSVLLYGMAFPLSSSSFTIGSTTQVLNGAWSGSQVIGTSYTRFDNVGVTSGNLAIQFSGSFNGFQLIYSPVPEPASFAALGIGVPVLLRRKRRRGGVLSR